MNRKMKMISMLVVSLMFVSVVSSCQAPAVPADVSKTTEEETSAAEMEEKGSAKDTLVMLSAESFTGSWDPAGHTILANNHVEQMVFDRLWEMDWAGGKNEFIPSLATEWKYLDDGSLEIKLRKGVKFHDGSDFDAEDVAASIDRFTDKNRPLGFLWPEQQVVEIVDDFTVRVSSPSGVPFGARINLLSAVDLMSSDDIKNEDKLKAGPNGTGAFKFIKYENEQVDLEANEDYWEGAPKIKKIYFRYVGDPATRLAALQSGEADWIERVESEQIPIIEADDKIEYMVVGAAEQKYLVFKWLVPPMEELLVRKAIAYAIDRDVIANDIMEGYASAADSFLPKTSICYSPAKGMPTYDPEKSKELLIEAGYPNGEGLPEMVYKTSAGFYPKTKEYGEYIVSALAEVGIKVKLEPMETASWLDALYSLDPSQMIDTGWAAGIEPNGYIALHYGTPGIVTRAEDPELQEVIDAETQIMDPEERCAYIDDVVFPMLAEKVPMLPLVDSVFIWAIDKNLKGFYANPASELSSMKYVYFTAE